MQYIFAFVVHYAFHMSALTYEVLNGNSDFGGVDSKIARPDESNIFPEQNIRITKLYHWLHTSGDILFLFID